MEGDRNEADRILGEDWMMTGYRRFLEAWEKHPQRELLDERKGEVDEDGGLVEYWLRAIDQTDERAICIGLSPEKVETDELADARRRVARWKSDGSTRSGSNCVAGSCRSRGRRVRPC